jgi:ubiquinone/menaquinone biosynthesis C-methylase UbiE
MRQTGISPNSLSAINYTMPNQIKLLHGSLLDDTSKLEELTHWLRVLNRPNGWHYDLDHIWILDELEKTGIQPGATIIDAGAGQGIMQYLLAAKGYNVISLDFSPRTKPPRTEGIFSISGDGQREIAYAHSYMNFISYGVTGKSGLLSKFTWKKLREIVNLPARFLRRADSYMAYRRERRSGQHKNYGHINYVRAPFHDVPLENAVADAVISVSAIEHADIELFRKNIDSLLRLLKPNKPLLVTTSATAGDGTTYDDLVQGWCFSRSALADLLPECTIEFDTMACSVSILKHPEFMRRLDSYYYLNPTSPFFKKKFSSLPYLPVAIEITKKD